jgi:hypothetical protein
VCKHYRGFPQQNGHVCCRADDPEWPRTVPSVCVHGKYVPHQPVNVAAPQLLQQFVSLVYGFGKLAYRGVVCRALTAIAPALARLSQSGLPGADPLSVPPDSVSTGLSICKMHGSGCRTSCASSLIATCTVLCSSALGSFGTT